MGLLNGKNDFSKGPVWKCVVAQAVPLTIAQLVQLLYNIVDRIYLGHMGEESQLALTGVGLTFPIITLIMAFAALFGIGGVPLFSMAAGKGDNEQASKILGNSFALLTLCAVVLTVVFYALGKPILFLFGASEDSYVYAAEYLRIYLVGTMFFMITTGLNGYINAQGFPKIGMMTTVLGAVTNIILDPVFIFGLGMGVSGAALATIIGQGLSAIWVMKFFLGKRTPISLQRNHIRLSKGLSRDIAKLGSANFIMQGTNFLVQVACNATLQSYGGDLYVGVMTLLNSIREVFTLPMTGIANGSLPVISFNYGAKQNGRVKETINFNTLIGIVYSLTAWLFIVLFPKFWLGVFSDDIAMVETGISALRIYFFGFVFMAFQFAGQTTFQAIGDAKHAIFFSLLRKAIIVVPLTLLLPVAGFGVNGVFLAEPISNVVGGLMSYCVMRKTVYRKL